jgi:hypothetical protein
MAEQRSSRSKKAAAQPVAPIECPPHEMYRNEDGPAWPNKPDIGLQQGDEVILQMILTEAEKKGHSTHNMFRGKNRLGRAVSVYKLLPQSYKNKIWKKAADHLIATHYDPLLAPDSKFLPTDITQPIWPGAEDCETVCPTEPGKICPWKDDCKIFYDIRKPRWDRQHEISDACYRRWNLEEFRRIGEAALDRRRATLAEKKKELERLWKAEEELSRTMFEPKRFPNEQEDTHKITVGIRNNQGEPDPRFLAHVMSEFDVITQNNGFTLLDFQCAIADYFHDGMPGFRISSTKDPKISGIRVHDIDMIRIGKQRHQEFMYLFLSNVLTMIRHHPPYRFERVRVELDQLEGLIRQPLFALPGGPTGEALNTWRDKLQLHGTRIEDSLIPRLSLPPDESPHVYHTSLSTLKGKNPIHSYHAYLQSGQRRITVHITKGEVNLLTKPESQRVVTFLLFVLFGPSYETNLPTHPVQFTFDAHKGHMNRLLATSRLPGVLRLVTPYNIADSAMTEKFKDVDPDDEDLVAEIEEEEDAKKGVKASIRKIKEEIKKEAKIGEEEEEEEDDAHTAAQKGDRRFIYKFNKNPGAPPIVVSDTNMIFDNNWLIYYKNRGFTQQSPYLFSMNLVDAGLHQYIMRSKNPKIKKIPSSFYTVEAPFSNEITRGPSLNYLMMGLMRGSKSNIFGNATFNSDELYDNICELHPAIPRNNDIVKGLLPIYTIPASSHSLPLFQYIAKAPLFAYHMMYDLKHQLSALPSRIKWAGDREQYMAIQDVTNSAFVTLDTTGYYCALANRVPSILERKLSIKLLGFELDTTQKKDIAIRAAQTPLHVVDPVPKPAGKGAPSKPVSKVAPSKVVLSKHSVSAIGKDAKSKPASKAPSRPPTLKVGLVKKNSMKNGGNYTRKNAKQSILQSIPQSMPGREYFFLNWLYPLTMSVNTVFYDRHHAEHAYVLLQDLQKDLSYPLLFPALQEQLIHVVSLIPNVPNDLMDAVTTLTADTYHDVAPPCLIQLEALYTSPHLSIFSQPAHKETLLGYLREMKEKLSRRHPSNDSTTDMLHILLTPDLTQDQEKVCLALALLFERLHGRIQNRTSYLGQILGITGGPVLECVDDQEAWEYLTTVMEEDMAWITDLSRQAVAPTMASMRMEAAPAKATMPAETPITNAPKMFRLSAKKHNVVRGPVYDKLKKDLRQLRSNRVRAVPMPMAAAVAGGSLRKTRRANTRRAKKGSRRRKD